MMGHKEKLTADEQGMLTGWRKVIFHDKGRSHKAKKLFSRRIQDKT